MGYYTRPKATFANYANDKKRKPHFDVGDRVRVRLGRHAGYKGRILQELTGVYEVALYNAGFGATTWVRSHEMEHV